LEESSERFRVVVLNESLYVVEAFSSRWSDILKFWRNQEDDGRKVFKLQRFWIFLTMMKDKFIFSEISLWYHEEFVAEGMFESCRSRERRREWISL
jgi:hypothetical protein